MKYFNRKIPCVALIAGVCFPFPSVSIQTDFWCWLLSDAFLALFDKFFWQPWVGKRSFQREIWTNNQVSSYFFCQFFLVVNRSLQLMFVFFVSHFNCFDVWERNKNFPSFLSVQFWLEPKFQTVPSFNCFSLICASSLSRRTCLSRSSSLKIDTPLMRQPSNSAR